MMFESISIGEGLAVDFAVCVIGNHHIGRGWGRIRSHLDRDKCIISGISHVSQGITQESVVENDVALCLRDALWAISKRHEEAAAFPPKVNKWSVAETGWHKNEELSLVRI